MKTVLAFGAHPDDIEWRIGGTLLLLAKLGYKIKIVDLTRGEKGSIGTSEERIKEAEKSAKLLGAERKILDLGDGNIKENKENKNIVKAIIEKEKPDIIFSPFYEDRHSDHEKLGKILKSYDPIFYLPHSFVSPTHIVDISQVFKQRMNAACCFKSQFTEQRIKDLTNRPQEYGKKIGAEYGEKFFCKGVHKLPAIFKPINTKK